MQVVILLRSKFLLDTNFGIQMMAFDNNKYWKLCLVGIRMKQRASEFLQLTLTRKVSLFKE